MPPSVLEEIDAAAAILLADPDPSLAVDALYESLLDAGTRAGGNQRRTLGAFYTPPPLVEHILNATITPTLNEIESRCDDPEQLLALRLVDPACGSGRFLRPAAAILAERLARARCSRSGKPATPAEVARAKADVLRNCIFGVDIDAAALEVCRLGFTLSTPSCDDVCDRPIPSLHLADSLASDDLWSFLTQPHGFDFVIGNPPFLNQLDARTTHSRERAGRITQLTKGTVGGYADPAGAFLHLGVRIARPGGSVGMVQPLSLLSTRDNSRLRSSLLEDADLVSVWIDEGRTFSNASVRTCAGVFRKHAGDDSSPASTNAPITVTTGRSFRSITHRPDSPNPNSAALSSHSSWSILACRAFGVPTPRVEHAGTLAEVAIATADFRDQYYGLRGRIIEGDGPCLNNDHEAHRQPRLITSGLIDLASNLWGHTPARVHGVDWHAPIVDLDLLAENPLTREWAARRLIPKVLLATQTRVIEAVVDEPGSLLPGVPVITLTPRPDGAPSGPLHQAGSPGPLWMLAAAVASPVACVAALEQTCGSALSATAIKLSARQTLSLPLPSDHRGWIDSADHFKRASNANNAVDRSTALHDFAEASVRAFGLSRRDATEVLDWWTYRLRRPARCRPRSLRSPAEPRTACG
ncbi:MAG: SAM-dependent DNA methyltransferase [Phycisphaeraceae bacterium]|nr:SAM-dependent DNA methyltransferase [Phycisphaeraceae bacterium]